MSVRIMSLSLFAALMLALTLHAEPTTAPSGNLAGNWKWELTVQENPIPWTATITKDGDKYTGSAIDGYDNSTMELKNIKLTGDTVSFLCERTGDFEIHFNYSGKLTADGINGTAKVKFQDNDPNEITWKATRVATATTMPATMPTK